MEACVRATRLFLENFRCFPELDLADLSSVNVLIGRNNSGKTSILRALHAFQQGLALTDTDLRAGCITCRIAIEIQGSTGDVVSRWNLPTDPPAWGTIAEVNYPQPQPGGVKITLRSGGTIEGSQFASTEPNHWIVPFLGSRKSSHFDETVNILNATQVSGDFRYLASKLSRLDSSGHPKREEYSRLCESVLGFTVTAVPANNGQIPGAYVGAEGASRSIEQMGEGVRHVAALLAELVMADRKLFLIEEPENDLHPDALKKLLDVVLSKSDSNQFIVTTHSSIVATHLGSSPGAKLYEIVQSPGEQGTSHARDVGDAPSSRMEALRSLGYELADFDMWSGWLLFEESSAERIARDYLIPWFAPKLKKVRTLAGRGADDLAPSFAALERMVLFTHLETAYRGRCWVVADGDDAGARSVEKLKSKFGASWGEHCFRALSEKNFEAYYPSRFGERRALASTREQKRQLLDDVLDFCEETPQEAKEAFAISAVEIIEILKEFESAI